MIKVVYQLFLAASGRGASVCVVLPYDSQGMTSEALLSLAERVIQGRMGKVLAYW